MSDGTTKKPASKKPASSKKPAQPKKLTDKQLVEGLMEVQKRKLTNAEFSAVTATIKLLQK